MWNSSTSHECLQRKILCLFCFVIYLPRDIKVHLPSTAKFLIPGAMPAKAWSQKACCLGIRSAYLKSVLCRWDATRHGSNLAISFIPLGLVLGLIGTFTDSLLGAICQYTGYSTQLGRVSSRKILHRPSRSMLLSDLAARMLMLLLGSKEMSMKEKLYSADVHMNLQYFCRWWAKQGQVSSTYLVKLC